MQTRDFLSPLEGKIVSIEKVPDEAFSSRVMGDGFAVIVSGNNVVAPISGTVTAIYPTGHAVCIEGDSGIQVLIHVGLDSYKVQGLNTIYAVQGQKVKQGDLLVRTNVREMKKRGIQQVSPVVFLHQEKITLLKQDVNVASGENSIVEISYETEPAV